jgi:transposase
LSIATTISISGEKLQQRFERNDDEILALENWIISKKCNVVACESTSYFWISIYGPLMKYLPVLIGNVREMFIYTQKAD